MGTFERCCPAPLLRQLEAEAIRETCWTPAVTPKLCCDLRKGVHGDSGCWNGPYTFDICCPNEAKLSSDFRKSCWLGGVSEEMCCDTRTSPRGDPACWNNLFQFETCCSPEVILAAPKIAQG